MAESPRIHAAARGFDAGAEAYERSRPEYPADALGFLAQRLAIEPGRTVVDLAAGTGKLTRGLLAFGPSLVAVEPSEGMRAVFHRSLGFAALDGTAESIPLPDGSADAVVVGQAFHWFRAAEALEEIARVLRPSGGLGLLWNRRDESVPWVGQFGAIIRSYDRGGAPSSQDEIWKDAFARSARFGPIEERSFPFERTMPRDELIDRALSISYIAAASDSVHLEVAKRVRDSVLESPTFPRGERVPLPYRCDAYAAARTP
ncbi:MAG: class I SAM-dependent methyltransferase [Thermoplasmata archaeon]|nr:class I SAM-dependent methyltransferase [Thermoplasmata archaeon]